MPTPYADAYEHYWRAGWRGVLPLPPGKKTPPPAGYTGHHGITPSFWDCTAWAEDRADGNVCLRLPADLIGLDVDDYGSKPGSATLHDLTTRLGPLPPTWRSSSRPAGTVSGIYLYRAVSEHGWVQDAGPGIEIIQHGHRYMVAAPSVHPDTGSVYAWYGPHGDRPWGWPMVPRVDNTDIPALPEAWVTALALTAPHVSPADITTPEVLDWLNATREGEPCRIIQVVTEKAIRDLRDPRGGSRHDVALRATRALAAAAGEGHAGGTEGLAFVHGTWKAAVADPARGTGRSVQQAADEWGSLLRGAVRLAAAAHPTPRTTCTCRPAPPEYVTAPNLPATAGWTPPVSVAPAEHESPADGADTTPDPVAAAEHESLPDTPEPTGRWTAAIDITHEPEAIATLITALRAGLVPDTYTTAGTLVTVTGTPPAIEPVTPDHLRRLLATGATHIYRTRQTRSGTVYDPASPSPAVCRSVLSEPDWGTVPPLTGVVTTPVLRADGTLLTAPGYDPASGLYHVPTHPVPHIPARPDREQVAAARWFLCDYLLADMPFVHAADRANYIALLITPLLRARINDLVPLGVISATTPGTGKTLATDIPGLTYGQASHTYPDSDPEMRKVITTLISGPEPVVVFDNVAAETTVSSAALAKLLTGRQWDDRLLQTNRRVAGINDKLWLLTGNGVKLGGDIASRAVLVRLDARCAQPDLRTGFKIPNLPAWIQQPANRGRLLWALLTLAADWAAAGGKPAEYVMRGFTGWACVLGGFLTHHGISGFLANTGDLAAYDMEAGGWEDFIEAWHGRYQDTPVTAYTLTQTAGGFGGVDVWEGRFITDADGKIPSVHSLGKLLASRRGAHFGGYILTGEKLRGKTWMWKVTPADAPDTEAETPAAVPPSADPPEPPDPFTQDALL